MSFYLENDSRILKPNHKTDRHYTNGTKLVYLTQPNWSWLNDFSSWDAASSDESVDTTVGLFLGQNIYTPDRVDEPEKRKEDDRVFAGWLYTGLFAQRATDDLLEHVELNVGVVGPSSKAECAQKQMHEWIDSDPPIGWEDQLADEFAADFSYMRKQRMLGGFLTPTKKSDFVFEYGFTVGSVHRHAEAGLTYRYGFNLDNTFGPGRLSLPAGISSFRSGQYAQSGYLFARATGRAVEHNRFLTGLDEEPLVGEFQVGVVYQYKKLQIGYSQTFLTHEFEEQSGTDSYGAITILWQF